MAPYVGLRFFNAVKKIDMNFYKNAIIPIFTSFIKLQLDFTKILLKNSFSSEHHIESVFHAGPPFHHPTTPSGS